MQRRELLVASAVALATPAARADVIPFFRAKPPPEVEVRAVLATQAERWSAGDVEGFCAHYDDDCIFVSPSGLTQGRAAVLERYRKKYGAAKETMGALSFELLGVTAGDQVASVALRWRLAWPAEAKKPAAEGYSVVGLRKRDDRWLVVHDASL
jgi:uncharacterized protein (TIGR02246 family)